MPPFLVGQELLYAFLSENMVYPQEEKDAGIGGKVYVKFTVSELGEIKDVTVLKGVSTGIDAEAVRVINLMPDCTPAKKMGKAVSVEYDIPINFQAN